MKLSVARISEDRLEVQMIATGPGLLGSVAPEILKPGEHLHGEPSLTFELLAPVADGSGLYEG